MAIRPALYRKLESFVLCDTGVCKNIEKHTLPLGSKPGEHHQIGSKTTKVQPSLVNTEEEYVKSETHEKNTLKSFDTSAKKKT